LLITGQNSHAINLVTGRPQDAAFALYTVVPADKAAILPAAISFTDGVVLPFALEAATCVLSVKQPGIAMPGVSTPAFNLPYPSLNPTKPLNKTLVVYGGSSSSGSVTTQLATAAGIDVVAIASAKNLELCKSSGAVAVIDYHGDAFIEEVVSAVRGIGGEFVGIFDAIGTPETHVHDLELLEKLNGPYLACTHPPPEKVPAGIQAGMIFAVNEVATPVWREYVTPALEAEQLKCLPSPTVVGKGLEFVNEALKMSKAGVSGTKLVVEL
jgi:NADPH:quinone reductase-like Zn-dependent oxidoreductase